jgi:hypothetical protein
VKKCPACAYRNAGGAAACGVCGRDLSSLAPAPEPRPAKKRKDALLLASGFLLLACAAGFNLLQDALWKAAPAPAAPAEGPFDYSGVVYSLEAMAGLRHLPAGDQLAALPLLKSSDGAVSAAAASAVGAWLRAGGTEAPAGPLLGGLLDAAAAGRRQAAVEAGFVLVQGSPGAEFTDRARAAAGALIASGEPERKTAGYFLSSMAGLEDFAPQLRQVLLRDTLTSSRLYAACALARLGDGAGHAYLEQAARGGDPAGRPGAVACLSYSAVPGAEQALLELSKEAPGGRPAESAKRALMLRKQLAIIKK